MPTETSEGVGKIHPIMRKQSFYVWFLGAQEARGVRDDLFVRPVLKYLLEREKDVEPTKVTLQVNNALLRWYCCIFHGMHEWNRARCK